MMVDVQIPFHSCNAAMYSDDKNPRASLILLTKYDQLISTVILPSLLIPLLLKCFDKTTNQTLHQSATAEHELLLARFRTGWLDWREEESIGSNQAKLKCLGASPTPVLDTQWVELIMF